MFEEFPDTDSDATGVKVVQENTEDAGAIVDVEGIEGDIHAELDEGNKSNENYLNDMFLKYCFSLTLRPIRNDIHATNCVLQ